MKVNLKTTNDENAAATPTCHQRGQRTVNGIIGNTRRGIVIDKTLDPDSNNPVANKPVSTALATLAGKIDAALQKPTGLTKTKLVGVGTQGQENIEIGENLTLKDGKLAAAGGIPVVEGTLGEATGEGDIATLTIPNAQTDNFILHIAEQNANVYMQHFGEGFCGSIPADNISTYIFIIYDTFGLIYSSSYIEHIEIMGNVDPITFTSAGYFSWGANDDILYSRINENLVTPLYPSLEDTNKYTYYCTDENKMLQEKQVQLEETQTATLFNKYKIKIPKGVEYSDMILPFITLDNEDDGKVLTIVNKQVQWATPTGGSGVTVTFED